GSTGNSVLISTEKTRVLVDAGLSARQTLLRLGEVGEDFEKLDGILITHEHGDHAGGLRVLLNTVDCPVYISEKTHEAYLKPKRSANAEKERMLRSEKLKDNTVEIESSEEFRIGDIDFEPFSVPHDAADNFGFVAKNRGHRIATLMDFGHFTPLIRESLRGCDGIVVESNHSLDMLKACPVYSWDLKQRISSNTGHLSNEALSDWLTNDFDGGARDIVLTHLSQKANEPNLAKITAESALRCRPPLFASDARISLSRPDRPTDWIEF
ncbi:MAG: MBL fold metallo-hydrolase, partial [Pyrinomonadaceae bacterium]|nr:MBL fold metallo-hydrolase [Pyrinomonadaceae bacterium]